MVSVEFDVNFPSQLKKEFSDILKEYQSIVPLWVKTLRIHYVPNPPDDCMDAALEVMGREEYRMADIIVYPNYLMLTDLEFRKLSVLHELCHNFFERLRNTAYLMITLLEDDNAKKLAAEQVRQADESATQDLAEAFKGLFDEKKTRKEEKAAKTRKNNKNAETERNSKSRSSRVKTGN